MNTQADPDVTSSEFVAAIVASYDWLQEPLRAELLESEAMERVAGAWINIGMDEAIKMVPALIETLDLLSHGEDVVESAKRYEQRRLAWHDRRRQAVEKIREAAELLHSQPPVDLRSPYALKRSKGGGLTVNVKELRLEMLEWSKNPVPAEKTSEFLKLDLRDPEKLQWLSDMGHLDVVLRGISDALESVRVGPIIMILPPEIPSEHIGTRGRAADPSSALNGVAVRVIHSRLPVSLRDNYALISRLASHAGINVSRQTVRGILLRGLT